MSGEGACVLRRAMAHDVVLFRPLGNLALFRTAPSIWKFCLEPGAFPVCLNRPFRLLVLRKRLQVFRLFHRREPTCTDLRSDGSGFNEVAHAVAASQAAAETCGPVGVRRNESCSRK